MHVVRLVSLQVVFRKVADVLREKELAERDRYDPPVELSTDHPVRRLISRFRKLSCSRIPSVNAGLALGDLSPTSDTLSIGTPLQGLTSRKTHSVDATHCGSTTPITDVCSSRPSSSESNKCVAAVTVSNGGAGVSSGRAAWRRLVSRASSADVTATAAAGGGVSALPSNTDNNNSGAGNRSGSGEERALLSDSRAVPRTPCSKWGRLLSPRVSVAAADNTTTMQWSGYLIHTSGNDAARQ